MPVTARRLSLDLPRSFTSVIYDECIDLAVESEANRKRCRERFE